MGLWAGAKEGGRCKFAREGALHFESASEAQEYAAELLAHRSGGFTQGGAGYDSGGGSKVALIAERDEEMSLEELDAHMGRLKRDPSVWEQVVSSPSSYGGELAAGTFVEIGARRFFKIGDPDVWVTRDGEHLTREEFARVVQNTTTPVIVNPAEVRWYERPVDE